MKLWSRACLTRRKQMRSRSKQQGTRDEGAWRWHWAGRGLDGARRQGGKEARSLLGRPEHEKKEGQQRKSLCQGEGCKGRQEGKGRKKSKNSPAVQVHSKWRGCSLRTAISQRSQNNKRWMIISKKKKKERNTERDCLEEESLCCIFLTAFKMGENRKGGWTDPSISKHVVPAWLWPGCVPGCL